MHRYIRPEKGNRTTSSVPRTEHGHLAGLGCHPSPSCSIRAEDFPKVVVIGAGMAGLSATRELRRKGWPQDKVVLLEASRNIGGRMRTRRHRSGAMCDHGAAYIHGTTGNPLTALASEAGINLKQVSESNPWIENSASLALYSGGKRATAPEVAETDDAFYELVKRVTRRAQSCEDSFFRASDGIDEILEEEPFCSLSPAGLSRLRLRLLMLSLWHGCDLKDMQLRSLDFGMLGDKPLSGGQGICGDFPGPNCMVEGGVERIVQAVANPEVRGCLRLNAMVTHVSFVSGDTTSPIGGVTSGREKEPKGGVPESVENEATAMDANGGSCVRVDFAVVGEEERRESVWADAVIVAVPLSLLQQGAVEFDPPIPERTSSAISRLRMGNYEKIIMEFEEPFWPADAPFIGCCPQPPPNRRLQPVPHATALAASLVTAPLFLENYLYSKGVPVLTAAFAGELGRMAVSSTEDRLEENSGTKDAQARDIYIRLVKPALEDAFGNGEEIPDPVSVETTSWGIDPLQKGSYSFFPIGARDDDFHYAGAGAAMGIPGAEPGASEAERVFFAGEATIPGYEGSMHGAYLSGVRAVDDITHAFNLPV